MPNFPRRSPLRLAVLISGGGTTLLNLIDKIGRGELDAKITVVVSSNPQAGGLKFAAEAGIDTKVVERRAAADDAAFSRAVFDACRSADCHLVAMAGFLKFVAIPPDFEWRVVNIHPALIPAFCGLGYYGHHVHQAVLDYGAKVSGCTVHFVDNQYDHGPILLQRTVAVHHDDTAAALAGRVFEAECQAYPDALRQIASGRLRAEGRRVWMQPE
ncbi:MAG: phosphoribosylglycinamide formyltransferase [Planctomycetia bacterium 21-64-5]|nr:MAG: phosphoribosylglycinamide formyltransferase [Planctomycetia bacterium 21-64-5]HQU45304.1 phosphoribosylglycinamide formyltransferase [Pirellulales bacterium]